MEKWGERKPIRIMVVGYRKKMTLSFYLLFEIWM
jgi:hypothetical protein